MMNLFFQQVCFLLRKLGWKALLLLVCLWVFCSGGNFMMEWNGPYVDSIYTDNNAIYYWLICVFFIGAISVFLLYSIYRYKTRWMLIQGNRLSYVWADILFVMIIFILWYAMFMWIYYTYSIRAFAISQQEKHIVQAIQMFYLHLPDLPFIGQIFPYTIQNIIRSLMFNLCISSCIEFLVLLLIKEKHKLLEGIYLIIAFVLVWYVLMKFEFYVQILFYISLFVINIMTSKKSWNKKQMGG